ncbi:ATP-grasp domain-containing protein [Sporosarcina sp. 179-K 3D1 HS]|uniref:ATP-grasp domain-containing protein n=1 Tax=Sporosarcina sp. 179-K 3D1 HS TaxID=3232169 RepID=UPI0039A3952E
MNFLITSVSRKVTLIENVKDVAKRLGSSVIYGGDLNEKCIGRYFVDEFWWMPPLDDLAVSDFISYCQQNQISFVIPTRDKELLYFAKNLSLLEENGIFVMVSGLSALNHTSDKLKFYQYLKDRDYSAIETSLNLKTVSGNYFVVKERFGSGSKRLYLKVKEEEAIKVARHLDAAIYQPYIEGIEFSIDVYVDQVGKSKGAVVRERVLVVNGESQITRTARLPELEKLAMELAEVLDLRGHVMFQAIVDETGTPHIIECNPRFGGASTLSVAAGLDSFYWFFLESTGKSLEDIPFTRSEKELTQVRYAKDLIF